MIHKVTGNLDLRDQLTGRAQQFGLVHASCSAVIDIDGCGQPQVSRVAASLNSHRHSLDGCTRHFAPVFADDQQHVQFVGATISFDGSFDRRPIGGAPPIGLADLGEVVGRVRRSDIFRIEQPCGHFSELIGVRSINAPLQACVNSPL